MGQLKDSCRDSRLSERGVEEQALARRIARLLELFQHRSDVQETAACARALATLSGPAPKENIVDAAQMGQALLTARVIRTVGEIPWPASISREQDAQDPAFLPPIGVHLPLFARDATLLGRAEQSRLAWLDPWGWCGPQDGPMVTVWFGSSSEGHLVGKLPSEQSAPKVLQRRSDDGHGILTSVERNGLSFELFHWPVILDGVTAWALVARLKSDRPRRGRLAFAVRPSDMQGSHPIFNIRRDGEGVWHANGKPVLSVAKIGDSLLRSTVKQPDIWHAFSGARASASLPVGELSLRCPSGQASAAEVYEMDIGPADFVTRFAIVAPPATASAALVRTSEKALWAGAIADQKGLFAAGSQIQLCEHQALLEAARYRLLIDGGPPDLAGCLGIAALARLGFVQRAGERLSSWFRRGVWEDTDGALIAWAATEFLLWTGERSWLQSHGRALRKLLDRLASGRLESGGFSLFGPEGSLRWSEIWRVAALLNAARTLRSHDDDLRRWGLAGAAGREGLIEFLGEAPWSAAPGRAPDGASAALLAAGWLRLVPSDHPRLLQTVEFLSSCRHDQGVLLNGGAHVAATAILLALEQRRDPGLGGAGLLARYASPTGALPTARHMHRGALGSGDDPLSAALFLLLVLDNVRIEKGGILIGPLIRMARNLPTPFGRLDIEEGRAVGRWRGEPVKIGHLAEPSE
jgi:hypothetical protein